MRKNSLKRIFAALALSAVATTSVASISAFAEEAGTTEDTTTEDTEAAAEVGPTADGGFYYEDVAGNLILATADEIAASSVQPVVTVDTVESEAGAEVTLNISVNSGDWNSTGIHVNYDTENLELVSRQWSMDIALSDSIGTKKIEEYDGGLFFTTAGDNVAGTTNYASITFKVTEEAQPGDFYPVTIDYVKGDIFSSTTVDETTKQLMTAYTFTKGIVNGGVQIPEEETTTTTTTTTTVAEVVETTTTTTTTAKPVTTTTAAPKTESPKTGVAGVGVAAAGLVVAAGAAFVLRKKED